MPTPTASGTPSARSRACTSASRSQTAPASAAARSAVTSTSSVCRLTTRARPHGPSSRDSASAAARRQVGVRGGRGHRGDQQRPVRGQPVRLRGGQQRPPGGQLAGQQVLQQVAADPVRVRDLVLLELDVHPGGVGGGVVRVPHHRGGQRQRGLVPERRVAGPLQQRLPEDLLADPERAQVVLQGQPGPGPAHRRRPDERHAARADRPLGEQRVELHPVVPDHLVAHVGEERRVLGRVGRDLQRHPGHRPVGQLARPRRAARRGSAAARTGPRPRRRPARAPRPCPR